jgi:hypothetical protein
MSTRKTKHQESFVSNQNKRNKIVQDQAKYVKNLLDNYDVDPDKFKVEFNELIKIIDRQKKFPTSLENKGGKKRSKTSKISKRSKRFRRSKNKKTRKGGFGKGSCPFVTPPPAWNATGYSHFYSHSKNGVAPGGVPVFPGHTKINKMVVTF